MAWFEMHQTMPRHKKTLVAARILKLKRREVVGLMVDLWAWGIDNATIDGRLEGLTAQDIAETMDYPRSKGKWLCDGLTEAGFLDVDADSGTYILHDWRDYAGKLNEKREADRRRKSKGSSKKDGGIPTEETENSSGIPAESKWKASGNPQEERRNSDGIPAEIQRTSDGIPSATVPNRTLPYPFDDDDDEDDDPRARACARACAGAGTNYAPAPPPEYADACTAAAAALVAHYGRKGTPEEVKSIAGAAVSMGKSALIGEAVRRAAERGVAAVPAYVRPMFAEWRDMGIDTVLEVEEEDYLRDALNGKYGEEEQQNAVELRDERRREAAV